MHQIVVKGLIREFLIKNGYTTTLNTFDKECKIESGITKMDIIMQLGMAKLIRRNNESLKPLSSMIEILVQYLLNKKAYLESLTIATKAEKIEDIPLREEIPYEPTQGVSRLNKMKKRPQSEYKTKNTNISRESEEIIPEDDSYLQKPIEQKASPNKGAFEVPRQSSNKQVKLFNFQEDQQPPPQPPKLINMKRASEQKEVNFKIQEDIETNDIVVNYQKCDIRQHNVKVPEEVYKFDYNKSIGFNQGKRKPQPKPITQDLKRLLFQGTMASLPKSWSQPFIFKNDPAFFGLHQLEGGPCGVLASVQAYYIKHFLFSQSNYSSNSVKSNCLIAALADIFYKSNNEKLILTIPARGNSLTQAISVECCDQIEYSVKSQTYLYEVLLENSSLFFGQNGVVLFFYSLILTKGCLEIQKEMDQASNPLIGNHGHCTQEAVNLMLTGKAISNCFDGNKQIDDMTIKGIEKRSEIGFLTIFEHFQYMEVGKNLKEPLLPIWVICKEFHYSVVFGCNNDVITDKSHLKTKLKEFDLVFYDGLNNSDDLIILTIRRLGAQLGLKKKKIQIEGVQFDSSDQVTPLIECLLKTKYGDLELDWNDSMPIL